jgi:hypothetical protein
MTIPTESLTVAQLITRFRGDVYLAHQWVSGASTDYVVTNSGSQYPTIAKMVADTTARLTSFTGDVSFALAADEKSYTTKFAANPSFSGSLGMTLPAGTTANREANPVAGRTRYNTTLGVPETNTPKGWVPLTNVVLQALRGTVPQASGTTIIPADSTVPQPTEGTLLWSKAFTPTMDGTEVTIEMAGMVDCGSNGRFVTLSFFRNNTFIGAVANSFQPGNAVQSFSAIVFDKPTAACTYSCRIGVSSSATWYFGRSSSATFGGGVLTAWKITEALP